MTEEARTLEELLAAGEVESGLLLKGDYTPAELEVARVAYEAGVAHGKEAVKADLLRAEEALREAADKLDKAIATNKQGPEYGWTHPDEPADELRRHVGFVVEDIRAALSPEGQRQGEEPKS